MTEHNESRPVAATAEAVAPGEVDPQKLPVWKMVGPGIVSAATGVGGADLVATLIAGQRYGYALLWAAIFGTFIKIMLVEGVGRYVLATGHTMFHGWRTLGRWTTWYFGPYIVIWGFVYGAAAMAGVGLPLVALFPGSKLLMWAIINVALGFALTWLGRYAIFEKIVTALVGLMFLTVVGLATLSLRNLPEIVRGLIPMLPADSFIYVMSLAGGIGGTITLAAYGYWMREKGWTKPTWMRVMRVDNTTGYIITGIFVVSTLIMGGDLLYTASITLSSGEEALIDFADVLGARYGDTFATIFLIGFWAASFSSLLGVWNGVSLMFADFIGHVRGIPENDPSTETGGKYYRMYLLWLTFPPLILIFLGKPTYLIIAYNVLGAFFMPFLALTLLLLLNRKDFPKERRNGPLTNAILVVILLIFVVLCGNQLVGLFT
ncbi:MAG: Nramp family divalent metal transporter [Corynebacterium sp.]|nr:Nramp family divalent metal transporter [Corynebacterium sp.]